MKKTKKTNLLPDNATIYGSVTIGSKGQVVIPAQARKDLKLKPGDRLLAVGKFDKILGFIKPEEMTAMLENILNQLRGNK